MKKAARRRLVVGLRSGTVRLVSPPMTTIDDVRKFWDANPLYKGVDGTAPGSREFFDNHTALVLQQNGGAMHEAFTPACDRDAPVLSLGCGIGFWLPWYWERGYRDLTAADLSPNSLALAKRRAELNGVSAKFDLQNCEAMTFADNTFAHIECHGVIHHSPNPQASISEIHRVLRPGGRAVVTVYYKNALHYLWPVLQPVAQRLVTFRGRGRESMFSARTVDELIRMYDGADNPIGLGFSARSFKAMFGALNLTRTFYTAPLRQFLPSASFIPRGRFPMMIGAVIQKD
jgi:SAM-dependent methyltransferase